jgi:hypothetical protein
MYSLLPCLKLFTRIISSTKSSFLLPFSHYILPLATTATMTTEDTETNPPPLETIAPACFACKAPGVQRCSGCENARYCSEKCQKSDWRFHRHLCEPFNELGPRPGLTYYRGILFPAKSAKPTFIWVEYEKETEQRVNRKRYTGSSWTNQFHVDRFRKFGRTLEHTFTFVYPWYPCSSFTGQIPQNRALDEVFCLQPFRPSRAGAFLAHGIQKHVQSDLDTSALGPILDLFRYKAMGEAAILRRRLARAEAMANSDV